jgi:hypothetical protein
MNTLKSNQLQNSRRRIAAKANYALLCGILPAFIGCPANTTTPDSIGVTQTMRDACPILTDEVLEGFIQAISGFRDDGLSEEDALVQWTQGCENIPEDGNFEGDVEACQACLPVIVGEVYGASSN